MRIKLFTTLISLMVLAGCTQGQVINEIPLVAQNGDKIVSINDDGTITYQQTREAVFGDATSALDAGTDSGDATCGSDNWAWANTGSPGGTNANDTTYVEQNTNRWDNAEVSDQLNALNFGFTGLTGTIDGIQLDVYGWETVSGVAPTFTTVQLTTDSGTTLEGTNQAAGALSTSDDDVYDVFGGAADDWGDVITVAEAMTTGFGTSICWTAGANNSEANIDHIRMTITYTPQNPPTVALNTPADTATDISLTPDLLFTGTDGQSNEIEYNVQVHTTTNWDTEIIRESNTVGDGLVRDVRGGTASTGENSQAQGQSFLTTSAYNLAGVEFMMYKTGTPTDNTYVEIRSGSTTGTLVATSELVDNSTFSTFAGRAYFRYDFASPPALSDATTYYYVILRDGIYDATNIPRMDASTGSDYSGGANSLRTDNAWAADSSSTDLTFRNYGAETLLIDKLSVTPDATFAGTGDPHPWPSGNQITYTVQAGDTLSNSTVYYWRVAGTDPLGSDTYGAWATTRSFTTLAGAGGGDERPRRLEIMMIQ